ncbi:hypothetical protein BDB01DRAFT_733335, partial [Pilobolus umbonatus]
YIPVYLFLTTFCNNYYFPGPHKNIDKLLLILYQLIKGYSTHQMNDFINDTTYYRIYEKLYIKNDKDLEKWIDDIKYNNIEFNFNEDNFIYPIRKQKNIDLNKDEEIFNYQLGGYRSRIETYFSDISKILKSL